ncbi:MAG: hypothetical protein ACYC7E_02835 [Armatimonadota bacterium]
MVSITLIALPVCFSYSLAVLRSGIDRPQAIIAQVVFWACLLLIVSMFF